MFVGMEKVADGVWLVRGGFPAKIMNVYLIADEDGVTVFDGGIKLMGKHVERAAAELGGARRVVLGHSHPDHRGIARHFSERGVPIWCHSDERADAEGDGGVHYMQIDKLELPAARALMPHLLHSWDDGPVPIARTLDEGDEIGGFRVVHTPGHAPGMIALWRESDRLALVSDLFYTLNPQTGLPRRRPAVPHRAFNWDDRSARESVLKVAALEPLAAWPGHTEPVLRDLDAGSVRSQLEAIV